jgi:hypothetical protein
VDPTGGRRRTQSSGLRPTAVASLACASAPRPAALARSLGPFCETILKRQSIATLSDIDRLESLISSSAEVTAGRLQAIFQASAGLDALARLKFTPAGCDPLEPARELNVVEQINQSFTYLAGLAAVRWLLSRHPANAPYTMNLGTTSGSDIASSDGVVAGEIFAATHPDSNDKLRKDLDKVGLSSAAHKYVFYLSPRASRRPPRPGITAVKLEHPSLARL